MGLSWRSKAPQNVGSSAGGAPRWTPPPAAAQVSEHSVVTLTAPLLFRSQGARSCAQEGSARTTCLPPRSPLWAVGFREDPPPRSGRAPSPRPAECLATQMTSPDQLRALAQRELGPESAALLADWEYASAFDAARAGGADELDALLQIAFEVSKRDREIQGEFLSYFWGLLYGLATPGVQATQERMPQKGETDLMQSIVGDLLPGFESLYFNSRAQFLSLIQQRLRWKRLDRMKSLGPVPHSLPGELDELSLAGDPGETPTTPLNELIQTESEALISRAILSLAGGDRRLIRAMIDGEARVDLTSELGVTSDALRQRLHRARAAFEKALQSARGPGEARS